MFTLHEINSFLEAMKVPPRKYVCYKLYTWAPKQGLAKVMLKRHRHTSLFFISCFQLNALVYYMSLYSWFNKTCRFKQLTPNYINIRVSGNNPKSERTKKSAIRYRINQELKFQYAKKQQLNEQLYKTHLECANLWSTTWQIIQTTIDSNIQSQMERHYNYLD